MATPAEPVPAPTSDAVIMDEKPSVPISLATSPSADIEKPAETAPEPKPSEESKSETKEEAKIETTEEAKPEDKNEPKTEKKAEEVVGEPKEEPKEELKEEAKTEAEPSSEAKPNTTGEATWPEISADHPLSKFLSGLPEILKEAGYAEVYGIELNASGDFHTKLILQKFLRANANDITKATGQLLATLKWRKEFQPLKTMEQTFESKRFGGLGYVMILDGVPDSGNKRDVATFNIYGAVEDNDVTFGDLDGFLRWRVGLMELGISKMNLKEATAPIPDYNDGPDPYQGYQIHDYQNIRFWSMHPAAKAASKKTMDVFRDHYPETLSRKFFVNVPAVMGWMFSAMKLVLSKETVRKFTVLSYGNQLAAELGDEIPEVYGGKGAELEKVGETLKSE